MQCNASPMWTKWSISRSLALCNDLFECQLVLNRFSMLHIRHAYSGPNWPPLRSDANELVPNVPKNQLQHASTSFVENDVSIVQASMQSLSHVESYAIIQIIYISVWYPLVKWGNEDSLDLRIFLQGTTFTTNNFV